MLRRQGWTFADASLPVRIEAPPGQGIGPRGRVRLPSLGGLDMAEGQRPRRVQSVLFVCAWNSVRSPMAEAIARHYFGKSIYVQSAGVRKGEADGFAMAALDEIGIDGKKH